MSAHFLSLPRAWLRPSAILRLPARLITAAAVARSRRALAKLDDHLLRDIGLSHAEAQAEASRSAWDAPLHWKG